MPLAFRREWDWNHDAVSTCFQNEPFQPPHLHFLSFKEHKKSDLEVKSHYYSIFLVKKFQK
jgi:hypothetical protein